jgi:hypothetical protein
MGNQITCCLSALPPSPPRLAAAGARVYDQNVPRGRTEAATAIALLTAMPATTAVDIADLRNVPVTL